MGICECGCGEETVLPKSRFRKGHYARAHAADVRGEKNPSWKGGVTIRGGGYRYVHRPDHPKSDKIGYIAEHRLVAERALGKPLPDSCEVHHINGDRQDNRPENLVVCEDCVYHQLIEHRTRAYRETGDADAVRCAYCDSWGGTSEMTVQSFDPVKGPFAFHEECRPS